MNGVTASIKSATTTSDEPAIAAPPTEPPASPSTRATVGERIALVVLLVGTAVMYLWNITIDGMGNQFYAGAAQAGSKDWEALLFGSLDSGNFITVDKPPVSQWVMGLFGQVFGFSSATMLVPQALMAVATVALLYAAVTRISGRQAGLLAGAALAFTPVAALMFRFNNPDAVMVLLMMAGAYCTVRALEHGSGKWMAWAGVALGFAFLAKMLEGLMVMPALGLAYLIAAPTPLRTRLLHLMGALAAFAVASGWFVLLTLLWPASSRPYIAGSTDNNFMNLVLGYNGFARVLGKNHLGGGQGYEHVVGTAAGANAARGHGGGFGGFGADQAQGLPRLFTGEFGFEIGWLVPAALVAMVLVVASRGRAPRTDLVRAGAVVFGLWLLIDGLVLSFMKSMVHPYYSLSIAPAAAGMFAIGVHQMWQRRESLYWRVGLVALILTAGGWGWWTLGRNADWLPPLRWVILTVTVVASIALLVSPRISARRWVAPVVLALGLVGGIAAPAAYAFATIGTAHEGGGPTVGPAQNQNRRAGSWGEPKDDPRLDAMLQATHTKWSAAIDRSSAAAGLELTTDTAVMAIGGFGGSDPTPTLGQFIDYVSNHQVGYYLTAVDDPGSGPRRSGAHDDIADWVAQHFTPTTVGKTTVYDLSANH
jgi:4-amino-4-deoxy-L-arabinose transferase-like glycosyltransferase